MQRTPFNEGWTVRAESEARVPQQETRITLPHDAMIHQDRDPACANGHHTGYYPGGRYRYSRLLEVPTDWAGRTVLLEFEGVYHRSQVFLNGNLVGGHPNGYSLFRVDLSAHLLPGEKNRIEVVSDDSEGPTSRWYTGSGIYRPVTLLSAGPIRFAPAGPRIRTVSVQRGNATIAIDAEICNDELRERTTTVRATIIGPAGGTLARLEHTLALPPHSTTAVALQDTIPDALLWSPDSPNLNRVELALLDRTETLDTAADTFGIRTLEVDARRGLRVNGASTKLRGACIHHDNGVLGATEFDAAADRRIRVLKASGFNAIRSAHNPASAALLRACDRHGMLVMDELTDVWLSKKGAQDYSLDFEAEWERDLEAMIEKDVNHPSVIMYSIGNEITDTWEQKGIALNRAMATRARALDPTRFVTNCLNGFLNLISTDAATRTKAEQRAAESGKEFGKNAIQVMNRLMVVLDKVMPYIVRLPRVDTRTRDAFADVDIAGYNYMQGRYGVDTRLHPQRVIVGSETNAQSLVKRWPTVEAASNILGEFVWTGWDYIGEAGLSTTLYDAKPQIFLPYPALLAGTPIIDITGHRQTQAFHNEYAWKQRTAPYLAVQPLNHAHQKIQSSGWRNTDSVHSWSWEGYEGTPADVEVYADASRVELLLNGRSIGSRPAGAKNGYLARFRLPYSPGELTAVAYDASGNVSGRDTLVSANSTMRLTLSPEVEELRADGSDLAYIPIELTDENGILRPLADRPVTVLVEGAGHLLGLGSANPVTPEAFVAPSHTTFYGRALVVVRTGHEHGEVRVTASAEGCESVTLTIPVRAPLASLSPVS